MAGEHGRRPASRRCPPPPVPPPGQRAHRTLDAGSVVVAQGPAASRSSACRRRPAGRHKVDRADDADLDDDGRLEVEVEEDD